MLSICLNLSENKTVLLSTANDSYDEVKTGSLKIWLKKNDPDQVIDNYFKCGEIRFFDDTTCIQRFDSIDKYIDRIFHYQLVDCLNKEILFLKKETN